MTGLVALTVTRASELPPKLRRALAKGELRASREALAAAIPDRAVSRARGQLKPGHAYRCHTCGAVFTKWAPVERHVDGHGGGRIVEYLEPTQRPEGASNE